MLKSLIKLIIRCIVTDSTLKSEDDRDGGAGGFPAFRGWIGRPIVDEVGSPPEGNLVWHFNSREAGQQGAGRRRDVDPGASAGADRTDVLAGEEAD